jgi:hypothetical protein
MSFSPGLKRSNRLAHHQDLFKTKGPDSAPNSPLKQQTVLDAEGNNSSPSWRNVYKKRCFDEFKKSRQKLMNRFRDLTV